VHTLCEGLKLPVGSQIAIALSLYLSSRPEMIEQGEEQLIRQLQDLKKNNNGPEINKKLLEELLFQISRSPELSFKLEEEYNYLLELAGKSGNETDIKLYNFINCDWQFFAQETTALDKPAQFFFRKVEYIKELGPFVTSQPELLKTVLTDLGAFT
jgi:hypothetical protein